MDRALVKKLTGDMRKSLQDANEHKKAQRHKQAKQSIETASQIFEWMKKEKYRPLEQELTDLQKIAQSLGFTEEESRTLFSGLHSVISAKKKKVAASSPSTPAAPARSQPGYHPPPGKSLPGFLDAKLAKRKTPVQGGGGLRKRWKDYKNKWIYEWDSQHGELEKWDWSGKNHQGSYDPKGKLLKGPDPTKNPITPTITTPMTKSKAKFSLFWFAADGDDLVGEEELPTVTQEQVLEWFFLPEGEPLTDSYPVRASQRLYLAELAKHKIDLNKFDYFLECYQTE